MEKRIYKAGCFPALTDEERLLISRAAELSARCDYSAVASSFLSPREQRLIFESGVARGGFFFGGAVGATRRKLVFLPAWMEFENTAFTAFSIEREKLFLETLSAYGSRDTIDEVLLPLQLKSSGYEELSHRDWLGALMALGIKRETIGDICFFDGNAYVFAEPKAAVFIENELSRAGRAKVSARICTLPHNFEIQNKFDNISTTVASPRLDGVVRALCSVSRDDAAEIIERGQTELNYFTETEIDKRVSDGDIISVRGYGKFIVDSTGETTKKGRFRLAARKFV